MKKIFTGLACLGGVAALAGIVWLGYMNNRMYDKMNALQRAWQDEINRQSTEGEGLDEDGNLVIAEVYPIVSTKAISQAYLSGDVSELGEEDKKTLEMAKTVIESCVKTDMTEYEKELAIYEWIVKNVKYDEGSFVALPTQVSEKHTPYGVLTNKSAVCVGYATTFGMFMEMLNIPCEIVHDEELSHSWNRVQLEGEWYNVDCTFDAGLESERYKNFNVCDSVFSQSHSWNTEEYPAATATKYSYAVLQAKPLSDKKLLPSLMKKAMKKGHSRIYYKVPNDISTEWLQNLMVGVQNRVTTNMPTDFALFPNDADTYVLAVYFDTSAQNALSGISEEEMLELETLLNDVFGEEYEE